MGLFRCQLWTWSGSQAKDRSAVSARKAFGARLIWILIRAQYPEERLNVDHVMRCPIGQVSPYLFGQSKQAFVRFPVWPGAIIKLKRIFFCSNLRDLWFEKNEFIWFGNETKNCYQGPGKHSCLFAWEILNYLDEIFKSLPEGSFSIYIVEQASGKCLCRRRGPHRIS